MITELFLGALFAVVEFALDAAAGLVPAMPGFMGTALLSLGTVWGWVQSAETWVPASFALTCCLFVVGTYVVSWSIMLARMILSYLTLGGGAT